LQQDKVPNPDKPKRAAPILATVGEHEVPLLAPNVSSSAERKQVNLQALYSLEYSEDRRKELTKILDMGFVFDDEGFVLDTDGCYVNSEFTPLYKKEVQPPPFPKYDQFGEPGAEPSVVGKPAVVVQDEPAAMSDVGGGRSSDEVMSALACGSTHMSDVASTRLTDPFTKIVREGAAGLVPLCETDRWVFQPGPDKPEEPVADRLSKKPRPTEVKVRQQVKAWHEKPKHAGLSQSMVGHNRFAALSLNEDEGNTVSPRAMSDVPQGGFRQHLLGTLYGIEKLPEFREALRGIANPEYFDIGTNQDSASELSVSSVGPNDSASQVLKTANLSPDEIRSVEALAALITQALKGKVQEVVESDVRSAQEHLSHMYNSDSSYEMVQEISERLSHVSWITHPPLKKKR